MNELTEEQSRVVKESVRRYRVRRAFKTLSNSHHEALQGAISLIAVNVSSEKEFLELSRAVINEVME